MPQGRVVLLGLFAGLAASLAASGVSLAVAAEGAVAAKRAIAAAASTDVPAAPLPPPPGIHITRFDPPRPVTAGEKWGGDARLSGQDWNSRDPVVASRSDGTLYAAAARVGESGIDVYVSDDDGQSWSNHASVWGPEAMTDPCLAIGEGLANRLLVAFVYGPGTSASSVLALVEDLDTASIDVKTIAANAYLGLACPRLCVDSPECSYWFPYAAYVAESPDGPVVGVVRSTDYGDTWPPASYLAGGLALDDRVDLDYGGSTLALVYSKPGVDSDVYVRLSHDYGGFWDPALQLTSSGHDEIEPRVAVRSVDGALMVLFSRQYGAGNHDIDGLYSHDGGGTWSVSYPPYAPADERRPTVAASSVTGRFHAAFWRDGEVQYTWCDPPAAGAWAAAVRVNDREASFDAWPALAVRPATCACNPDLNCDGVVDGNDFAPFDLAMNDPAGYGAAYPDCDIGRADTDCDGDIDGDDRATLECLIGGGSGCCPAATECAGVAWTDEQSPVPGAWFDAECLELPPAIEYLAIAPDEFASQAARLVSYRQARGLPASLVTLSDIGAGTLTAADVDAWLESYWTGNPRLRFVALIGDVARLPAFPLVYPDTGEPFQSDLRYACRDAAWPAQYLPLLAVGRLPAASLDQLDAAIDKIERFEAGYGARNGAVFFGHLPEMSYVAARDSALAANLGYAVTTLYSPSEAALMAALNDPGTALAFYYGHGSYAQNWPLHLGNLNLLTNADRPFLYFSGGCNFNDDSASPPLGHALLFAAGGSAGSTGAAVAGGYGYGYAFAEAVLQQSRFQATLGEAVQAALYAHQAAAAGAGQDVSYGSATYWFTERLRPIGDPALRIDGDLTAVPPAPAPAAAWLAPNRPNPFNGGTTIEFALPAGGHVRLAVYDATGRRVATLLDEPAPAGRRAVSWDGRDDRGRACPSGVYFCRLAAGARTETRRMALIR